MRLTSYLKYPERVGGISTNLVDFVEWRFVVWRGVIDLLEDSWFQFLRGQAM